MKELASITCLITCKKTSKFKIQRKINKLKPLHDLQNSVTQLLEKFMIFCFLRENFIKGFVKFEMLFQFISLIIKLRKMLNSDNLSQYLNPDLGEGIYDEKMLCLLCQQNWSPYQMFSVTHRRHCGHKFCYNCLVKKLKNSILKNEDMLCPIENCPNAFSEQSPLHFLLSPQILAEYKEWKKSQKYHYRKTMNSLKSFQIHEQPQSRQEIQNQLIIEEDQLVRSGSGYFCQNYQLQQDQQEQARRIAAERRRCKNKCICFCIIAICLSIFIVILS